MKLGIVVGAAVLVFAASASAQTAPADPVMQHYRAYDAALGRGDLAGAEAAAAQALAASEARDREGGSTARLAANLAQVRLDQGRAADALQPAQRALAIVEQSGAQAGVDPIYARLLVGRAELAASGDVGQVRLMSTLGEARARRSQQVEAYDAAIALGEWALGQGRHDAARDAFQIASEFAGGSSDADVTARAQARLGYAVALAMDDHPAPRAASGTRLAAPPDARVEGALSESLQLARPIAERDARRGVVTRAQGVYSSALAWTHARAALSRALGWSSTTAPPRGVVIDLDANDGLPACAAPFATGDASGVDPILARAASSEGGEITGATLIGSADRLGNMSGSYATSVVARITSDASGAITDARVLGSVDGLSLERALGDIFSAAAAAPVGNCSRARVMFAPVVFLIDGATLRNPAIRSGLMVGATPRSSTTTITPQ